MEPADRARRRHRHADDEERRDQKRAGERHVDVKGQRRQPDAGGDREPDRHRQHQRHQQSIGLSDDREAFCKRTDQLARQSPSRSGRTRIDGARHALEPSRDDRQERTSRRGRRPTRLRRSPHRASPGRTSRCSPRPARGKEQQKRRKQDEHHHGVEQPLENDRRKRRRALRRSRFASRYGRSTSPARAGSSALAANPMIVVRSALLKCTRPIGWSRYCQRSARTPCSPRRSSRAPAAAGRPVRARSRPRRAWKSMLRRNSASRPTAAASAITVRRCCRISDERRGARRERLRRPKPAARNYMPDPRASATIRLPGRGTARVSLAPPLTATTLPTLTPFRTGKVRDIYRSRRLAAHRRHRPHLRIRLRAGIGHPRQGQGADAVVGVLVRAD